jgi:uncharacterized protein YaaN involved in tellurite resistance
VTSDVTPATATGTPVVAADPPLLALQLAPADIIDPTRLDDARRQQADAIAAGVSINDSNVIATFGAGPQRKLSGFLDQLVADTRADEIGVAGALVTELATDIKALDLPAVKRETEGRPGLLAGLPVIGRYYSAVRRFRALHARIADHLAEIERRADTHLGKLKASNAGLDRLLDATEANLRELEVWVAGGQQALLRMRAAFEAERAALADSRDPVRYARLRDMAEQINAFETRLVRMHVAFTRGIMAIPQIRTAQQAGRIEIQNTLDTILFDLPDLKAAIIRVAALNQISRASDATAARRRIGRELQQIGIDALDQAYTAAKRTQGDMAGDVETLGRMTEKMLATIDKGLQIDRENRAKRAAAVQQLGEVRQRLLEGLRTHADQAIQG